MVTTRARETEWKRIEETMRAALKLGTVPVPQLLLLHYPRLGMSDLEAMLVIHLISFIENEKKEFPTLAEIEARMSAPSEQVLQALQRLLREGIVAIDEETDPVSGVTYEKYNLEPLYAKLAASWTEERKRQAEPERNSAGASREKDIFTIFEEEFARPLTPMEYEMIGGWLDEDGFPEELVLAALKEAVFAGKVHFRYIDRILLEWKKNRIATVEQAKEFTRRFRG